MSRHRRGLVVAAVGAALASCAPLAPPAGTATTSSTAAGPAAVAVREHLSGRYLALIGPKAQHDAPYLDTPETNFFCLRSFVDRQTGETAHQLYVTASYDANRDWDSAHDGAGQKLEFMSISRYKIACQGGDKDCSYAEEFAAGLPESELRQNPAGFSVVFTDQAGDKETIAVSAQQIAAQLTALAQQQKNGFAAPTVTESEWAPPPHQP
ncbi:MAG TPA: hypothetical protein VNV18_00055 [Stellaceae bacterium]|nr:hypothetical protein [Stellaceae bacterium]